MTFYPCWRGISCPIGHGIDSAESFQTLQVAGLYFLLSPVCERVFRLSGDFTGNNVGTPVLATFLVGSRKSVCSRDVIKKISK
jgi:hypothetical protein